MSVHKFISAKLPRESKSFSLGHSAFAIEDGVLIKYTGIGGEVVIPSGITGIGVRAFANCRSVRSVTIADGVTRIADCAFLHCGSLVRVDIPSSVAYIGEGAFYGCRNLRNITVPDSVQDIGIRAFAKTRILTMDIPKRLQPFAGKYFQV